MPPRGYALIFFFWALLAIITPTLISWSASAKPKLGALVGAAVNELKVSRRILARTKNETTLTAAPAPAPAPAPELMTKNQTRERLLPI